MRERWASTVEEVEEQAEKPTAHKATAQAAIRRGFMEITALPF
jgi:hypothetical protein